VIVAARKEVGQIPEKSAVVPTKSIFTAARCRIIGEPSFLALQVRRKDGKRHDWSVVEKHAVAPAGRGARHVLYRGGDQTIRRNWRGGRVRSKFGRTRRAAADGVAVSERPLPPERGGRLDRHVKRSQLQLRGAPGAACCWR